MLRRKHSIDHLRPEGRIKKDSGDWSSACQLEPDKTAFWLRIPPASSAAAAENKGKDKGVVIAVEVKPKGAVMPVGTLVPPGNNRLKYRIARFDAQQRFKAQVGSNEKLVVAGFREGGGMFLSLLCASHAATASTSAYVAVAASRPKGSKEEGMNYPHNLVTEHKRAPGMVQFARETNTKQALFYPAPSTPSLAPVFSMRAPK